MRRARLFADFFLWVFAGVTFWLAAHTAALFIPMRQLWLPGGVALLAGVITGVVGHIKSVTSDNVLQHFACQSATPALVAIGFFAGAGIGWLYSLSSQTASVFLSLPASPSTRLANAVVCGILGLAAGWLTAWLKVWFGDMRWTLFFILIAIWVALFGIAFLTMNADERSRTQPRARMATAPDVLMTCSFMPSKITLEDNE